MRSAPYRTHSTESSDSECRPQRSKGLIGHVHKHDQSCCHQSAIWRAIPGRHSHKQEHWPHDGERRSQYTRAEKAQATPAPCRNRLLLSPREKKPGDYVGRQEESSTKQKTHIGAESRPCFLDRAGVRLSSRKKKKNTQAVTNAAIIAVRRLDVRGKVGSVWLRCGCIVSESSLWAANAPSGERYGAPLQSLRPDPAPTWPCFNSSSTRRAISFRETEARHFEGDGFHHPGSSFRFSSLAYLRRPGGYWQIAFIQLAARRESS